ncbi:hypothetical protein RHSIM_Rhsim01G0020100 [Rhododendron simsii]|uniref:Uncharacterized protein n=1 Tax=Rhododendron simsii TaxID=118357 RepID=A0A834LY03_RHOSS|nr:hypothetical protein RHSIM_Rhsim01G0020100 [Rhododendron simsii]
MDGLNSYCGKSCLMEWKSLFKGSNQLDGFCISGERRKLRNLNLSSAVKNENLLGDGCIDYIEFVAMMQRGNATFGTKHLQNAGFSPSSREALPVF